MKVISQILPKIGCHGNVRWDIKKEVQIDHLHPICICRLTCWNQNCDIPIRLRMPVCQMNEYRPISAESQHNFHILPHFNSKTTEPIFTIFSHDLELFVQILTRASAER